MKTPSLDQLKSLAKDRAKAHSTYLKKLSKKPPKDLDYRVQEIHDEVFEEVDCLSCANCCKTTGPLFTSADIQRISKHFKMKEATFTDTYLRLDEDNDWVLKELPCPFLAHDNYCNIYDVRPKACREYPHTDRKKFHQIRSLTLKNTSICPAAFKVVERMLERIPIS
jgi:Fe-S-cluster containining protein